MSADGATLHWTVGDTGVQALLGRANGRVLVRVHCASLFTVVDGQKRIFSAAPDAAVGFATPHLPGGVFESWFTVAPG